MYSLSVSSLAKSLQLILEISALIYRLRAQCMISNKIQVPCDGVFVVIFFKTMYNKTIRFGFCDILQSQGLGKCCHPRPFARLITLTSTLIIPDITKTSPNNCLIIISRHYERGPWLFLSPNHTIYTTNSPFQSELLISTEMTTYYL